MILKAERSLEGDDTRQKEVFFVLFYVGLDTCSQAAMGGPMSAPLG